LQSCGSPSKEGASDRDIAVQTLHDWWQAIESDCESLGHHPEREAIDAAAAAASVPPAKALVASILRTGRSLALSESVAADCHRLGVLALRPPGGTHDRDAATIERIALQCQVAAAAEALGGAQLVAEGDSRALDGTTVGGSTIQLRSLANSAAAETLALSCSASAWVVSGCSSSLDCIDNALAAGQASRADAVAGTDGDVDVDLSKPGDRSRISKADAGKGTSDGDINDDDDDDDDDVGNQMAKRQMSAEGDGCRGATGPGACALIDLQAGMSRCLEFCRLAMSSANASHCGADSALDRLVGALAGCAADSVRTFARRVASASASSGTGTSTSAASSTDTGLAKALQPDDDDSWSPWAALSQAAADLDDVDRQTGAVKVFALAQRVASFGLHDEQGALRRAGLALVRAADVTGSDLAAEHLAHAALHSTLAGDAVSAMCAAEEAAVSGPRALTEACSWARKVHARWAGSGEAFDEEGNKDDKKKKDKGKGKGKG